MTLMPKVKGRKCNPCYSGKDPGGVKTFSPWCVSCQEKKRLGWRTGKEPEPVRYRPKKKTEDSFGGFFPGRAAEKKRERRKGPRGDT